MKEAGERTTAIAYDDRNRRVTTSSDLLTLRRREAANHRAARHAGAGDRTRVSDGPSLSTSDGIKVTTHYIHTAGSPLKVVTSTPYRPPADATLEWTCTQFDRWGRPTAIGVFKGATAPTDCQTASATRTGLTGIAYIADQTTITDPADKKRVEFRDALGRLVQVTEDPGTDPKLNYVTAYDYDPLNNLTGVFQYGHYVTPAGDPTGQPPPMQSRSFKIQFAEPAAVGHESGKRGPLATPTTRPGTWRPGPMPGACWPNTATMPCSGSGRPNTRFLRTRRRRRPTTGRRRRPTSPTSTTCRAPPTPDALESITSTVDTSDVDTVTVATSDYSYDNLGRIVSQSQTIAGHPDTFTFTNTYYKNDALKSQIYPSGPDRHLHPRRCRTCQDGLGRDHHLCRHACERGPRLRARRPAGTDEAGEQPVGKPATTTGWKPPRANRGA